MQKIRFILVLISGLIAVTVYGQDTPPLDRATLDQIDNAAQAMRTLESYTFNRSVSLQQSLVIETESGIIAQDQWIAERASGVVQHLQNGKLQAAVTLDKAIRSSTPLADGQAQTRDVAQTQSFVILPEATFFSAQDITPPEIAATYPQGWVNFTEAQADFPALVTLDPLTTLSTTPDVFFTTYDANTVQALTALSVTTHAGQQMQRYQMQLDAARVLDDITIDALLNQVDLSQLGISRLAVLQSLLDGTRMTIELWIGADDGRVHRAMQQLDVRLNIEGQSLTLNIIQSSLTSVDFSNFNESVSITAPQLAEN